MPLRLAMWSGPRNISTAMMRSFGERSDTYVTDEPLYAHYLTRTGLEHPLRREVLDSHDADARRVTEWLSGAIPDGKTVWYQKHMAHHLLPGDDRDWMRSGFEHLFLIREPRAMLASLLAKLGSASLEETGLPQQVELFEWLRGTDSTPVVVEARAVLSDPRGVLSTLCERVGLRFEDTMLRWDPGPRETDGVWASHWYESAWASTGFQPYEPSRADVPAVYEPLLRRLEELHARLASHSLQAPVGGAR